MSVEFGSTITSHVEPKDLSKYEIWAESCLDEAESMRKKTEDADCSFQHLSLELDAPSHVAFSKHGRFPHGPEVAIMPVPFLEHPLAKA